MIRQALVLAVALASSCTASPDPVPAEDPLPASAPIESITVDYPDAEVSLFGWGLHWIIVFFVLSIVFAFALRNRFGVTI